MLFRSPSNGQLSTQDSHPKRNISHLSILNPKGILNQEKSKPKQALNFKPKVKIMDSKSTKNTQQGFLKGNMISSFLKEKKRGDLDLAFYNETPLTQGKVIMDKNFKDSFKAYLDGSFSQDEMMYARNFPMLYSQIPSPRVKNLKEMMNEEEEQETEEDQDELNHSPMKNSPQQGLGSRQTLKHQPESFNTVVKRVSMMNRKSMSVNNQRKSFAMLKDTLHNQAKVKKQKFAIDKSLKVLKGVIQKNIQHRKQTQANKKDVGGGIIGQIGACAQNANRNQVRQDENVYKIINDQKQKYVTKNFSNISIVHEKREHNPSAELDIINGDQENYHILRPLYKRYFKENSDAYMHSLKDPYDPQYRQLLQHSDQEFDKLILNYLNKKEIDEAKKVANEKNQKQSRLQTYIQGGISDFGPRKHVGQKEQMYVKQLGNLDSYTSDHMINSLLKFDRNQDQEMPQSKRKTMPMQMTRTFHMPSKKKPKRVFLRDSSNRHREEDQSMRQNNSVHNFSSASEYKKKLDSQKKRGYFVIKRNQSLKVLKTSTQEGLLRDSSDESSQASMTEGQLEKLYSESIQLQNKLSTNKDQNLIKKLKQLVHLEDLKKSVYETNSYKLDRI